MAKKANKVTMFKSSDDNLHATAAECEAHESRLLVKPSVHELLTQLGHEADTSLTPDDVSSFVSANADALLKILAPLLPKKTRAPRGSAAPADAKAAPADAKADPADAKADPASLEAEALGQQQALAA